MQKGEQGKERNCKSLEDLKVEGKFLLLIAETISKQRGLKILLTHGMTLTLFKKVKGILQINHPKQ